MILQPLFMKGFMFLSYLTASDLLLHKVSISKSLLSSHVYYKAGPISLALCLCFLSTADSLTCFISSHRPDHYIGTKWKSTHLYANHKWHFQLLSQHEAHHFHVCWWNFVELQPIRGKVVGTFRQLFNLKLIFNAPIFPMSFIKSSYWLSQCTRITFLTVFTKCKYHDKLLFRTSRQLQLFDSNVRMQWACTYS